MIIDQFGIFFDDVTTEAGMTSNVVNFQPHAGREDPIRISMLARGANTGALSYAVSVEESGDNATFTAVGTAVLTKPDASPVLKSIRLPVDVAKPYVRLTVAVTGTPAGTLFAAVTRDHFAPYDEGLYIDGGRVIA